MKDDFRIIDSDMHIIIIWSSDYPHWDSDYPHASEAFLELTVSDETKHKILWDNCLRLYNLP
jgi:predicted TIM-barrel fold metal-dependent hydrolase